MLITSEENSSRPAADPPDVSATTTITSEEDSSRPVGSDPPDVSATKLITSEENSRRPAADPPDVSATTTITSEEDSSRPAGSDPPDVLATKLITSEENSRRPAADPPDVSATTTITSEEDSSRPAGIDPPDVLATKLITSEENSRRPAADPPDVSATTTITSEEDSSRPAGIDPPDVLATKLITSEENSSRPAADPPDVSATTTITSEEDSSRPAGTGPPDVSATKLITSEENSSRPAADPPDVSATNKSVTSEASSSNFDALHEYDVFVSHRGPIVNMTFVSHLYEALCTAGFHPCFDAKSFVKGKHAFNSINKALSGVRVHVAVFSKCYAESKYCLNELCDMLRSGKVILPVYLDVEPEHLRTPHQGPFAAAFRKHLERGRIDDIKKWEKALLDVADITGYRLDEVNMDEAQLKRRIVIAVQNAMPVDYGLQQVVPHRVGLQDSTREVLQQLDQLGIVGIVGTGGIGKTTLAKEVYNDCAKRQRFECQSFLRDVRARDQLSLQKQLVRDLLEQDLQNTEDFYHCFNRLSKKVLIVVDDIDDKSQFDHLIPALDKLLLRGSRILVTSRDWNVLNVITRRDLGGASRLYEMQKLNASYSQQLFIWHAFYSERASDGLQDLAMAVADACSGIPLALEVIGAYLFDMKAPEHEVVWKDAAKSLKEDHGAMDHKLQNMFNLTYEGLSSQADKMMFLDIASLMIGCHEAWAMDLWESCISCSCGSSKSPHLSLMRLIDKSLVKLDIHKRIRTHDVLRDMGRDVVRRQSLQEVGECIHLWEHRKAREVFEKGKGKAKIRGLTLAGLKLATPLAAEKFARITGLHFLNLWGCQVEGDFSTWSKELRLLTWGSSSISELPATLDFHNLVGLNLSWSKNLTCLWVEALHIQLPLRQLILQRCTALERLPENMGVLSRLMKLDLKGCFALKSLPNSIGQLQSLEMINLCQCVNLATLPNSISNLSKLREIVLDYCTKLKELPMGFGNLQNLLLFSASGTSLSYLPDCFAQLFNLEELWLNNCTTFQDLPSSIGGLWKLKVLGMNMTHVKKLPNDFGQLKSLKRLYLNGCKHLKTLSKSLGCLEKLEYLSMQTNLSLRLLPQSFGGLKTLQTLDLSQCSIGEGGVPDSFGALAKLKTLSLSGNLISTLPENFKDLNALINLHMSHCPNLVVVQTLPQNLEYLDLGGCHKLTNIPCLGDLSSLKYLGLNDCTRLTDLQGLNLLTTLVEVNISGCKMLCNTPGLNHNKALTMCGLNGSKISMNYDNNWSAREPMIQVINFYGNALPKPFGNVLFPTIFRPQSSNTLCMKVTISIEKECVAIVLGFCAHEVMTQPSPHIFHYGVYNNSYCSMEARILRDGQEVYTCDLFAFRHNDPKDQIYLCTLRKHHQFVKSLQFGDQIGVFAQFGNDIQWAQIVIKEGAIIMVHGDNDDQIIVVNSEVLSTRKSKDLRAAFLKLNLENNVEHNDHLYVAPTRTIGAFYICEYCHKEILIQRWTCPICDYDICETCHLSGHHEMCKDHEDWHPMVQVFV
ncbi:hypothetical protein BDL97_06G130100 [Sphagnum fallax]|nr:hypothetical protein BDL97_06G130100 [Sphagnum fallax]